MPKTILRLYVDDEGESHFEEISISFEELDFVPPAPPVLMSSFNSARQYGFELVPPGYHGDWHPAPCRVLGVYLSGRGEIEASDGDVRKIGPGSILLAEDTYGKGHVSRVTGTEEMFVVLILLPD